MDDNTGYPYVRKPLGISGDFNGFPGGFQEMFTGISIYFNNVVGILWDFKDVIRFLLGFQGFHRIFEGFQ